MHIFSYCSSPRLAAQSSFRRRSKSAFRSNIHNGYNTTADAVTNAEHCCHSTALTPTDTSRAVTAAASLPRSQALGEQHTGCTARAAMLPPSGCQYQGWAPDTVAACADSPTAASTAAVVEAAPASAAVVVAAATGSGASSLLRSVDRMRRTATPGGGSGFRGRPVRLAALA
jgi:hypothetical protein